MRPVRRACGRQRNMNTADPCSSVSICWSPDDTKKNQTKKQQHSFMGMKEPLGVQSEHGSL